MIEVSGKRVWVTAAGKGIGRACALAFAEAGADVFATDRDADTLAQLVGMRIATLDSADAGAVAQFVESSGPFDAVVHCVGTVASGTVLDCTDRDWATSFRVNVDSFYHLLQAILPGMVEQGRGAIVCIASVASSIKGVANRAAYGTTKAAMIGLTKSVAADYAAHGITCNAVCPGTVMSPSLQERIGVLAGTLGSTDAAMTSFVSRQPLGRLGTPEEIAGQCLYLASDLGRFVTGQAIAVDGGMTI